MSDDNDAVHDSSSDDEEVVNPIPIGPRRQHSELTLSAFGLGLPVRRIMVPQPLNVNLRCYPVSMNPGNERLENGGKILLPPSILQHLTRMNITSPMLFRLTNKTAKLSSHCGVLEFTADFNQCYLPSWMMRNLLLQTGDTVQVQGATLPVATYAKFEPQSVDFLDITNPKAMLENVLRNFSCLTEGEKISVMYNGRDYELRVLEIQPGPAVSIIECDLNVDFAAPVGYVEPEQVSSQLNTGGDDVHGGPFVPFGGAGNRLDGKTVSHDQDQENGRAPRRGIPDYDYTPGNLQFTRNFQYFTDKKAKAEQSKDPGFSPFSGAGHTLRSNPPQ